MNWRILTVGKPALAYAKAGRDEYLARIGKVATVEIVTVKASDPAREGADLLAKSDGCFRVILDEAGKQLGSRAFASKIDAWRQSSRPVAVIIGGANGHGGAIMPSADFLWSLGPLTLQHELALVVALEQIYRAHTILAGHPYHRD